MSTAVAERPTANEQIQQLVDQAPTLSDETLDRIVQLFRVGETH